jgi:tRNA (adenine22-N1)-methyltransferase
MVGLGLHGTSMSARIEAIVRSVRPGVPLYDLCCDHGLIGQRAYEQRGSTPVHLVDQSATVILRLRERLAPFREQLGKDFLIWQAKAEEVPHPARTSDFVLAGVGIPCAIRILNALFPDGMGVHRLIIAPQQKTPPLRAYLRDRGYRLISEEVLLERGRFREILVLAADGQEIAPQAEAYAERADPLAQAFVRYLSADQENIARSRRLKRTGDGQRSSCSS